MTKLSTTQKKSTVSGIPEYTDENGHLVESEVDAICLEYANHDADLALAIKVVAGDYIRENPMVTDVREMGEVAHPSMRNNVIIIQILGMALQNKIYNAFDPEHAAILKSELAEKLDFGANSDLTNPGYCDANGHLLEDGVDAVCLYYGKKDEQVAGALKGLVGNYIRLYPQITDIRQYLDSYTTRQRIGFMALNKIGNALKQAVDGDPDRVWAMLGDDEQFQAIQRSIFSILSFAQKEEGHLTKHDGLKLPLASGFIDRLFAEQNYDGLIAEIEQAKLSIRTPQASPEYGKRQPVAQPM